MKAALRGVAAVMLVGAAACADSTSTQSGVDSVNGVGGAVALVSGNASVTIAADPAARTLDLRAVESDPLYAASAAAGIAQADVDRWDAAAAFAETDPVFGASAAAGILASDVAAWTAAYGWGDHALAGYLTAEQNASLSCTGCVGLGALAFDPVTQQELSAALPTSVDGFSGGTIVSDVAVSGTLRATALRQNGQVVCDTSGNCPSDPTAVQTRVTGSCPANTALTGVNQDGTVTCASRPVTVQLPAPTWNVVQCASVSGTFGLGGWAVPSLHFTPDGACGAVAAGAVALSIPRELPAGPRPFRVRANVGQVVAPGEVSLSMTWVVAGALSGVNATRCTGSAAVTVPALPNVQAMTTVEFDFSADPALCGAPGDPLVLLISRTDAGTNDVVVHAIHAVFE